MNWGAVFIRSMWMLMAVGLFFMGIFSIVMAVMMLYSGPGVVIVQGQPVTGTAAAIIWYLGAFVLAGIGVVLMLAAVIVFLYNLVQLIYEFWVGLIQPMTAQISAGSNIVQHPLPGLGLPGLPIGFPANPMDWFQLLLLPADQKGAIPLHLLPFIDCMRTCFCKSLCGDGSSPGNIGGIGGVDTAADIAKSLLEDLKEQLRIAREKLEQAFNERKVSAIKYWSERIDELTRRIADLGG